MPNSPSKDETRQPAQQPNAEVEKLYESCCGSCGSPAPTVSLTLADLTSASKATDSEAKSGTP